MQCSSSSRTTGQAQGGEGAAVGPVSPATLCGAQSVRNLRASKSSHVGLYEGAFGFDGRHVQRRVVPGQAGLPVAPVGEAQLRGVGASGLSLVEPLPKVPALLGPRQRLLEGGALELIAESLKLHDGHVEAFSSSSSGCLLALHSHRLVHDAHEGPWLQLGFGLEAAAALDGAGGVRHLWPASV